MTETTKVFISHWESNIFIKLEKQNFMLPYKCANSFYRLENSTTSCVLFDSKIAEFIVKM